MAQRATIIIPTYWASASDALDAPGAYDHATELGASQPELERCLASLAFWWCARFRLPSR